MHAFQAHDFKTQSFLQQICRRNRKLPESLGTQQSLVLLNYGTVSTVIGELKFSRHIQDWCET